MTAPQTQQSSGGKPSTSALLLLPVAPQLSGRLEQRFPRDIKQDSITRGTNFQQFAGKMVHELFAIVEAFYRFG